MRPRLEAIAVQDAARDHEVVAGANGELAERRLEHAAPSLTYTISSPCALR